MLISYRFALLISIALVVPLGYIVRFYHGGQNEWSDFGGSVAYEIFWIMLVIVCLPRSSLLWTAIAVCLATCAIEFLQLWKPPLLQMIRATLPGRIILGNTFNWSDFPSYFVGSFLGWAWVRSLRECLVKRIS